MTPAMLTTNLARSRLARLSLRQDMVANEESGGGGLVSRAMLWFIIPGMIGGAYFIWFTFLRAPPIDPFSGIGSAVVNLEELNYQLEFKDLQAAGLLRNVECRKCDFSTDGASSFVVDSADAELQVTMLRQVTCCISISTVRTLEWQAKSASNARLTPFDPSFR